MHIGRTILVGESQPIRKIKGLVSQVAGSDLNVLICGETGVGKELVAQALHLVSHRRSKALVKVNCAAIPGQLLESELFGYERGAFTGADRMKSGKFELAHNGTILLDEIGDMPLSLQAKMLQVLQDFQFSHLGGKTDIQVDCWVLAATNQDLDQRIKEGLFREDLYYRLNIIKMVIPPLRERPEDIEPLIRHFAEEFGNGIQNPRFAFSDRGALEFLRSYSWPGNVRELKHTVKRLMLLGDWSAVQSELLARETRGIQTTEMSLAPCEAVTPEAGSTANRFPSLKEVRKKATAEAERKLISAVLAETNWNRRKAAGILQISYKALLYKIKDYDLDHGRRGG
jgi:two-component system response regulator AtoC